MEHPLRGEVQRRRPHEIAESPGRLRFLVDGTVVGEYVFHGDDDQSECPRPCFESLLTAGGLLVTDFRPSDHRWHRGLSFAVANVGDENFWGGPTYIRDVGYRQLPNVGTQRHESFELTDDAAGNPMVHEELTWLAHDGESLFRESRSISLRAIDERSWALGFATRLRNTSARSMALGSPGTRGRDSAGYGGLFWRGPGSFVEGRVLVPGRTGGDELNGVRSPWMAFVSRPDAVGAQPTVLMVAGIPGADRDPHWFVRSEEYPGMGPAPFYAEELSLDPEEDFVCSVALVICDGPLDGDAAQHLSDEARRHLVALEKA